MNAEAYALELRRRIEAKLREDLERLWRLHALISEEIVELTRLLDDGDYPEEWVGHS